MDSGGPDRFFIVGDHFRGRVVETPLPEYLVAHRDWYDAVFVTRP